MRNLQRLSVVGKLDNGKLVHNPVPCDTNLYCPPFVFVGGP